MAIFVYVSGGVCMLQASRSEVKGSGCPQWVLSEYSLTTPTGLGCSGCGSLLLQRALCITVHDSSQPCTDSASIAIQGHHEQTVVG